MSPIENAAREICDFVQSTWGDTRADHQTEFAEIIRRHLFPLVRFEDRDREAMYLVRSTHSSKWQLVRGSVALSDDEIRGPIELPE